MRPTAGIHTIKFMTDTRVQMHYGRPQRRVYGWILAGTVMHAVPGKVGNRYRNYTIDEHTNMMVVNRYVTEETPVKTEVNLTRGWQHRLISEHAETIEGVGRKRGREMDDRPRSGWRPRRIRKYAQKVHEARLRAAAEGRVSTGSGRKETIQD